MKNVHGKWVGNIWGTNSGNLFIELQQVGTSLAGVLRILDDRFGISIFTCKGEVDNNIKLSIHPHYSPPGVEITDGEISASLEPDGSVVGDWTTKSGTAGTFKVVRAPIPGLSGSRKVFVVHGQDEAAKDATARLLEKLELEPIILAERPNVGKTLIEKFEQHSGVDFAVVILTPDDVGSPHDLVDELKPRARQNVILELGYFIGRLSRERVCVLRKGSVEVPSDFHGVEYIPMDPEGAWKTKLANAIKHIGIQVDLNKL